jgi:twitching motility two-component system response regulator PilG
MTTLVSSPLVATLSILQAAAQQQITGCLTLSAPGSDAHAWQVYWGEGKIHYATRLMDQQERLPYLWQQDCPKLRLPLLAPNEFEYQLLWRVWQQEQLNFCHLRQLLLLWSQEALVHLLALPLVAFQFEAQGKLEPLLIAVPLAQTLGPLQSEIEEGQRLQPQIPSPFWFPLIQDARQLDQQLQQSVLSAVQQQLLTHVLQQSLSLYTGATWLKLNVLEWAMLLHPWIESGAIGLVPGHPRTYNLQRRFPCGSGWKLCSKRTTSSWLLPVIMPWMDASALLLPEAWSSPNGPLKSTE